VTTSCRFVSEQATAKNIKISVDLASDVSVRADPKRLRQLLLNLLSNAVKFTPNGGQINISAADYASGPADAPRIALSVKDTGIGIAPEHIDLVFEPFKQIDGALSRKYEGTGLGLPLARLIAEEHGGVLRLTSVLGEGTLVTVDLEKVGQI
jgi:signal transduction histidine kinase